MCIYIYIYVIMISIIILIIISRDERRRHPSEEMRAIWSVGMHDGRIIIRMIIMIIILS